MTRPGHFAGRLVEMACEPLHGLHQLNLRLIDDAGGSHIVYIAYGRGAEAEQRCRQMHDSLQIGMRYHGSAMLSRVGEIHTYWMGRVVLAADMRRPALVAQEQRA